MLLIVIVEMLLGRLFLIVDCFVGFCFVFVVNI